MSTVEYEFPLNEKIRTYLRIEHLLHRIYSSAEDLSPTSLLHFFEAIFAISEITERGDLKGDLIKDLEKQEKNLVNWAQHPSIDSSMVDNLLQQVVTSSNLLAKSGRLGQELKDDKFLASIKQRFSIPGGTCCFDLPHLHYWLNLPDQDKQQDINRWQGHLELLSNVVGTELRFIRERGQQKSCTANNGFYQDATDNTELLHIALPNTIESYPTVSGNKHRFSIRFMAICADQGKAATEDDIEFVLTCC